MQYEAVRLFVDRALLTQSGFVVTDANASAVAQICHRLDGIPLAIELAAARVKVLSVEQIAVRLDDCFRLLTGGSRTALPRHQTLRATIDWSYELLSEAERTLLERLSVFSGGWTLEAAEEVGADAVGRRQKAESRKQKAEGGPDGLLLPTAYCLLPSDVLDLLEQLVDKSLVVKEEQAGEARYRLLDTVGQYARERLEESGGAAAVRRRHRDWCLALAEQAERALWSEEQTVWLERLETEHDNLRAALAWSQSADQDVGPALRLAGLLWKFWDLRGYTSEGRRWLEGALARREHAPPEERWQALLGAGNLARNQGDFARATALYDEGLTLLRELGHTRGMANTLINLGNVALDQGEYRRAAELYEQSLVLMRDLQYRPGIALALNNLGVALRRSGDFPRATGVCEESLALFRELGEKWGAALSLDNLGEVARDEGAYERAIARHEESLRLRRELRDRHGIAVSLHNLGVAASLHGDPERAAACLDEALALRRELGERAGIAESLQAAGIIARQRGDREAARACYRESLALCREIGLKLESAACLVGLAVLAVSDEDPVYAVRLLGAVEALRETSGIPLSPADRAEYERAITTARAALDHAAFTAAWSEGRAMTLTAATEHALEEIMTDRNYSARKRLTAEDAERH
jgi:tetratricopeptide (TPR) repeat protein